MQPDGLGCSSALVGLVLVSWFGLVFDRLVWLVGWLVGWLVELS